MPRRRGARPRPTASGVHGLRRGGGGSARDRATLERYRAHTCRSRAPGAIPISGCWVGTFSPRRGRGAGRGRGGAERVRLGASPASTSASRSAPRGSSRQSSRWRGTSRRSSSAMCSSTCRDPARPSTAPRSCSRRGGVIAQDLPDSGSRVARGWAAAGGRSSRLTSSTSRAISLRLAARAARLHDRLEVAYGAEGVRVALLPVLGSAATRRHGPAGALGGGCLGARARPTACGGLSSATAWR